jgi:hypothetical protein
VDFQPRLNTNNERKIPTLTGEDILRWGHSPKGTFNIKEANAIKAHSDPLLTRKVWSKIWSLKHWPKISLFLWLVTHTSILTWDNLLKRGFVGSSICMLYGEDAKTLNHLANTCPYTTQVW